MSDARSNDRFKLAYDIALARFLVDPGSAELLAAIGASAWHRNGCMAFAAALADCLGGRLVSIGWYALLADHVALSFDGMLLDAGGAYSEQELLANRSRLARAPLGLWPLTSATVTQAVGDAQHRAALAALLASYLPNFSSTAKRKSRAAVGVERRRRPRKAATPENSEAARVQSPLTAPTSLSIEAFASPKSIEVFSKP